MKKFIIPVIFLTGCAAALNISPKKEDMAQVEKKLPGITYDELVAGFKKYKLSCASCHALYDPGKITLQKWNSILPAMFIKAKITDTTEKDLLRKYVTVYAK